jgi:hypothetical protein
MSLVVKSLRRKAREAHYRIEPSQRKIQKKLACKHRRELKLGHNDRGHPLDADAYRRRLAELKSYGKSPENLDAISKAEKAFRVLQKKKILAAKIPKLWLQFVPPRYWGDCTSVSKCRRFGPLACWEFLCSFEGTPQQVWIKLAHLREIPSAWEILCGHNWIAGQWLNHYPDFGHFDWDPGFEATEVKTPAQREAFLSRKAREWSLPHPDPRDPGAR